MYKTVMMDPPWHESGGGKIKRGADRHYDLMTTPQIIETVTEQLFMRVADDAHCYLWVTNNFLPDGLLLMRRIGFRYVTNLCWVKDRIGLGQYFRGQHELCLFGVTGRAMLPGTATIPTVINAPRGRHSAKPARIYEIAEELSREPRIELFARARRDGWASWGNELTNERNNSR